MKLARVRSILPDWKNVLAALASALLLIGAFPDFEFWFLAWFALVPLLWAVEREKSPGRSFVLGWVFGNIFFFGTCWWLTFAPITYAGFPAPLAYFLLFLVTSAAAVFPGIFAAITALFLRRFGSTAFLAVPFVWVFTEFLRYWITGNNWNAVGYSQAFNGRSLEIAAYGGLLLVSFVVSLPGGVFLFSLYNWTALKKNEDFADAFGTLFSKAYPVTNRNLGRTVDNRVMGYYLLLGTIAISVLVFVSYVSGVWTRHSISLSPISTGSVVALQPNVPMSGLTLEKWRQLRQRHAQLAGLALAELRSNPQSAIRNPQSATVIFPESPMNFMYEDDPETKEFINSFAAKNNVSVLFNSAEPDKSNGKFFNSAVMVGPEGKEVAQYDKIYLLPFGEAVPFPLEGILPGFVGNFSYGREYDLLPLGDAKAGVMICFESHFGQLSREYVRNGADVIIEMTNDGYLGPTPVLRQHLANAVFRAVETNRPVLRVTNVGITAYINERGEVLNPAVPYTEDTRVWSVSKSDGGQTFYVKYGDWFAWLCSAVTLALLVFGIATKRRAELSQKATDNKA